MRASTFLSGGTSTPTAQFPVQTVLGPVACLSWPGWSLFNSASDAARPEEVEVRLTCSLRAAAVEINIRPALRASYP
jgi:hypothetical protein